MRSSKDQLSLAIPAGNIKCLFNHQTYSNVDFVRSLLGVGVVLQAAAVLRYISYFEQFNVISKYTVPFNVFCCMYGLFSRGTQYL